MRETAAVTSVPNDAEPALLGAPAQGDGTCRGGYGVAVLRHYGNACAYCDLDFTRSYESWLHMSVDHVIPRYVVRLGYPTPWVEDLLNHAPCCRTCNEFLNGYRVTVPAPPATLAEFVDLREKVFEEKRVRVQSRHATEKAKFETWRQAVQAGAPATPSD
jgi:hypothetical protein